MKAPCQLTTDHYQLTTDHRSATSMLQIRTYQLTLRPTSCGAVEPWIGTTLRGVVARRFKESQCRHPPPERAKWTYCRGCAWSGECSYGLTYESQSLRPSGGPCGVHDPPKPIVLAPYYPLPAQLGPSARVPVRALLVGPAARYADPLFRALLAAGREPGLGPERITFELEQGVCPDVVTTYLDAESLPQHPGQSPGVFPRVGIGLTAPLFLSWKDDAGQRRPLTLPSLADLFVASLRVVRNLSWFFGERFDFDAEPLVAAARHVPLVDHCYEPFQKLRSSSRQRESRWEQGVVGGGVYRDVPAALLPWLVWGGRLHVGMDRVAGAGSWRLVLD